MEKIRVAVCDDAQYLCDCFRSEIQYKQDFIFVGEAYDSNQCIEMVKLSKPDVLLLDIQMETETAGIDVITNLKEQNQDMKIVVLTSYDNDNYIFSAFASGADDYVIKTLKIEEIFETIINVYHGNSKLHSEIAKKLAKKAQEIHKQQKSLLYIYNIMSRLSINEFEVLKAVYFGKSYRNIAKERFVEVGSVRVIASRILKKFEIKNMRHLIEMLREMEAFDLFDR